MQLLGGGTLSHYTDTLFDEHHTYPFLWLPAKDFPYNVDEGIEHHNLWSTKPLSPERLRQARRRPLQHPDLGIDGLNVTAQGTMRMPFGFGTTLEQTNLSSDKICILQHRAIGCRWQHVDSM